MHFQMLLKNNAKNLNAFGGAKIILNFKNKSLEKTVNIYIAGKSCNTPIRY